ncbi:MAG: hypothetical protein ABI855_15230 [Bacteroidota bacterium]
MQRFTVPERGIALDVMKDNQEKYCFTPELLKHTMLVFVIEKSLPIYTGRGLFLFWNFQEDPN